MGLCLCQRRVEPLTIFMAFYVFVAEKGWNSGYIGGFVFVLEEGWNLWLYSWSVFVQ